jgi:hypothetical protein
VAGVAVVIGPLASFSGAQTPAADVMSGALQIVATVEEAGGCDISLHGGPQLDEVTGRWLVAYSGVGAACDDSGAVLQRQGIPAEIAFFRRPNGDEVKVLINQIRASVRRGFACLLVFNGEPRFDEESALWIVRYYGSGPNCGDASDVLERQGTELRIAFHRVR